MQRTAIITGGTGGLGAAVTEAFLADGWRVVLPWVAERELARVERRDGLELVQADLMDETAVAEVARTAGDGVRAVVNLVGGFAEGGRVHETPVDEFEAQLRLNLRPAYLVTAAALPAMLAAGEGAVVALVDVLDAEYRQDNIRANAILPSVIDTPANRASMPDADFDAWVPPAQIAAVIRFLCSPEGAATSGAHVPVYGRA